MRAGRFEPARSGARLAFPCPGCGRGGRLSDTKGAKLTRFHRPSSGRELARAATMLPRQVLPRQFYLITRRCTQREFLLRPDAATNNAFLYCLIAAALRTGGVGASSSTDSVTESDALARQNV